MLRKAALILCSILFSNILWAQSNTSNPFLNLKGIASQSGFSPYYKLNPAQKVKIAIFDSNFYGYEADLGKYLPKLEDVHFKKGDVEPDSQDGHGKMMAELIYALMTDEGRSPQFAPEFYFYQVNGVDFSSAITDAIANKVEIISHSAVKTYGDNWDGGGFWNADVDRATAAGIVWVNNAGNSARLTYNSLIQFNGNQVVLPDTNGTLGLNCNKGPANISTCLVNIYLTWNDFKNDTNLGTNKDLDLILLDSQFKKVLDLRKNSDGKRAPLESLKAQVEVKSTDPEIAKGQSLYPRENVLGEIPPGQYYISVKSKNPKNFGQTSQLRIIVNGDFVTLNHYNVAESLLNPADNKNVITVGSLDSDTTSVSVKLRKPELLTNSLLKLGPSEEFKGNSNSAAIVAAGFGILKSLNPELNRKYLLFATSTQPRSMNGVFVLPPP